MGELDQLLEHALRDAQGSLVLAHLQRHDEDYWDRLVVAKDGQPLTFRGSPTGMSGEVALEDGSVLMVLACTPSGVSPGGHVAVPADEFGSPLAKMIDVVGADSLVEVEPPDQEAAELPPLGRDSFAALIERAALKQGEGMGVAEVEAQDGGTAKVVLDWERQPLLLWFEAPGSGERALMCIAAPPEGLVAEVVDAALRPLHSDDGLARQMSGEE